MPSEHLASHPPTLPENTQQQIKLCSSCHHPLSPDASNTPFLLLDADDANETSNVCAPCRTRLLTMRIESSARGEVLFAQVERELLRRAASLQAGSLEDGAMLPPAVNHRNQPTEQPPRCLDEDVDMRALDDASPPPPDLAAIASQRRLPPSAAAHPPRISVIVPPTSHKPLTVSDASPLLQTPVYSHAAQSPVASSCWASSSRSQLPQYPSSSPDPLVDITRLRVRSQGHHCLYPGASFQGTQKSGRNSYDVNVTIVVCPPLH